MDEDDWGCLFTGICILVFLAFWGTVIWVAIHFISKWW